MDGDAIFSALAEYAATASLDLDLPSAATPPMSAANLAVAPTTTAAALAGDAKSNRILSALVSNALLPSPSLPALLPAKVSLSSLAVSPDSPTAAAAAEVQGFLTSRLALLPSAARVLVGVWLVLLGLFTLSCGARSLFWGRELGRKRGVEGKGWLGGGVEGALLGSTVVGAFSVFLILAIVRSQSPPSLGGWATLAIVFFPAIIGGVLGGRWVWAARIAVAVLGSLSLSLLLTLSLRLSSVLPRAILFLVSLVLALPAVFLSRARRFSLPALCALSGAYLLILGIDVFPAVQLGFVDALGLLLARNAVGSEGKTENVVVKWTQGKAKGLVAAWWLASVVGGAGMGWWGLGIDGDEHWNSYLSRLVAQSPSPSGEHLPPMTLGDRLRRFFSRGPSRTSGGLTDLPRRRSPWDDDDDDASTVWAGDEGDEEKASGAYRASRHARAGRRKDEMSDAWDSDVETLFAPSLRRAKSPTSVRSKGSASAPPARYGALSLSDHEEEDEGDDSKDSGLWSAGRASMDSPLPSPAHARAQEDAKGSVKSGLSGSTAVSSTYSAAKEKLRAPPEEHAEEEADALAALPILPRSAAPAAMSERSGRSTLRGLFSRSSSAAKPAAYPCLSSSASPAPANAVPATPSLSRALDRVRLAQTQARGAPAAATAGQVEKAAHPAVGKPLTRRESLKVQEEGSEWSVDGLQRRPSMDEWWGEVVKKSEGR
ncbi:hypothetical protein JCM10213_009029 [Rhodosporidiobolus nylandii]